MPHPHSHALTDMQSAVMAAVDRLCSVDSGYCTGEIADCVGRQRGHETNRQHSALVGRELRALEAMGLVARLDEKLPVVWTKAT